MIAENIAKGIEQSDNPKLIEDFVDNTFPKLQAVAQIDQKTHVITTALYFANRDGLHPKEKANANQLAIKLGMTQQRFDQLVNVWDKEKQLFDEFYSLYMEPQKSQK